MATSVTVIILAYNQENYIRQTIDSVLNQERTFSVEVLINDDASSDSTPDIIREYQEKFPSIITAYIQPRNKGAMESYYALLSHCNGKYIMNISGDDYWLPGKMQVQFDYLEDHPEVGMCYSRTKRLKGGSFISDFGSDSSTSFEKHILHNFIPALTVCFRKDLLDQYLEDVHPELRTWLAEDYPMQLWFLKNSKVHYIDQELSVYRVMDGSISHADSLVKRIRFLNSVHDISLYYAGCNADLIRTVNSIHYLKVANEYLMAGDYEKYRCYNRLVGKKGIIKNIVSYLPYGVKFSIIRLERMMN